LEIGTGRPKIIVPIVDESREEIMQKAAGLKKVRAEVVEWRADFYSGVLDPARLLCLLAELRGILVDIPLLFTLRTEAEGGARQVSASEYMDLNITAAQSRYVDLVDVEIFAKSAEQIICAAHEAGALVVGSNHDFSATPPKGEIVQRLCWAQRLGADILKIAVMPTCAEDVLTLLLASHEMYTRHTDRPIIAISMSAMGLISRVCGATFGCALTFGYAGNASAPGQIPMEDLELMLGIMHKYGG